MSLKLLTTLILLSSLLFSATRLDSAPYADNGYSYVRTEFIENYSVSSLPPVDNPNDSGQYVTIDNTNFSFYKYVYKGDDTNNTDNTIWERSKFEQFPINIPNTIHCENVGAYNDTCEYLDSYGNSADTSCESDGYFHVEMSGTPQISEDNYYGCFVASVEPNDNNDTDVPLADPDSDSNNTDVVDPEPNPDPNLDTLNYGIDVMYPSTTTSDFYLSDQILANINNNIVASSGKISTSNDELSDINDNLSALNDLLSNNDTTSSPTPIDNTEQINILNSINSNISENNTNMETALADISSDITTSLSSSSQQNHEDLSNVSTKMDQTNQELSGLNTKIESMNDFMHSGINNNEASDSISNAQSQATSTVSSITGALNGIISSYTGVAPVVTGTGNHIFTASVFGGNVEIDLSLFENLRQYFDILWLLMLAYFNFKMYLLIIRDLLKKF